MAGSEVDRTMANSQRGSWGGGFRHPKSRQQPNHQQLGTHGVKGLHPTKVATVAAAGGATFNAMTRTGSINGTADSSAMHPRLVLPPIRTGRERSGVAAAAMQQVGGILGEVGQTNKEPAAGTKGLPAPAGLGNLQLGPMHAAAAAGAAEPDSGSRVLTSKHRHVCRNASYGSGSGTAAAGADGRRLGRQSSTESVPRSSSSVAVDAAAGLALAGVQLKRSSSVSKATQPAWK